MSEENKYRIVLSRWHWVSIIMGVAMLAPIALNADIVTETQRAEIIFRDFMARMVQGGEHPENIDPSAKITIQRWNEPLRIRVISDRKLMDDPKFLQVMKNLAVEIHDATKLEIEIFPDDQPANIYLMIASVPVIVLDQFKEVVFKRPGTSRSYEEIKKDLTNGEICSAKGAGPRGKAIYNWSAMSFYDRDDVLEKCLYSTFAYILGMQNIGIKLGIDESVGAPYSRHMKFMPGDKRCLRMIYKLPAGAIMSVKEIKHYINSHIDEL